MQTIDHAALATQARNSAGKIDVRTLVRLLIARGVSGMAIVEHLLAMGCPLELAYARASEHCNAVTVDLDTV